MSTKVHTGFRMHSKKLPEVLRQLERALSEFTGVMQEKLDRFVVTRAVELIDQSILGLAPPADETGTIRYPLVSAWRELADRQGEGRKTQMRDPAVDLDFRFTLWHHRGDDAIVGIIHSENARCFHKRFLGMGCARDFSYWNSSDRPDNISDRVWKKREKVWNDCLRDKSGPSFAVQLQELYPSRGAALLPYVPTLDARVSDLATESAFEDFRLAQSDGLAPLAPSGLLRQYNAFRRQLQDSESPEALHVAQVRARILEVLPAEITLGMLSSFEVPAPPPSSRTLSLAALNEEL